MIFFNNNEELLVSFKIAYLTSTDKIIYQDENIYNAERTFFANLDSKLNEMSVMKILDEPISDDIKQLGQLMFKNALGQFSSSGKYMNLESIEKSSLSVRDYVNHLSEVIVYLNLDSVSDSIFGKRIKKEYYKEAPCGCCARNSGRLLVLDRMAGVNDAGCRGRDGRGIL